MTTITASLFRMNRSSAAVTDDQATRLGAALGRMGLDVADRNGMSVMGMDSAEAIALGIACGDNSAAGDIIAASESDGTRFIVQDGTIRLLEEA